MSVRELTSSLMKFAVFFHCWRQNSSPWTDWTERGCSLSLQTCHRVKESSKNQNNSFGKYVALHKEKVMTKCVCTCSSQDILKADNLWILKCDAQVVRYQHKLKMEIILLNFVERPLEEQGQGLVFPVGFWSSCLVLAGGRRRASGGGCGPGP